MEYGLIGEKLGHSFSKIIHEQIADYTYDLQEIAKDKLDEFMTKREFKAINVTIPYKQDVIPYLYEITDQAKKIGAVNCIVNRDGKLYGDNTDYYGAKALFQKNDIAVKGKKVLILGTGGTSKTLNTVVTDLGASSVYLVSRSKTDTTITYEDAAAFHNDADIIVNTTPVGMFPKNEGCPIDIDNFPNLSGVVDVIYNPLNTALIVKAKAKGIKAAGGLYMLVAQAVYAAVRFLPEKFSDTSDEALLKITNKIYNQLYLDKQNIVLIGMPSCGKTTVGRALAEKLAREVIDTDVEIIKKTKKEITEIFKTHGERKFRDFESDIIAEVSKKNGVIIATGGGAILRDENVAALKQNGIIVFLDRPLDNLITTSDRPLSSNADDLKKRFEERYDKYKAAADISFPAVITIAEETNYIINAIRKNILE